MKTDFTETGFYSDAEFMEYKNRAFFHYLTDSDGDIYPVEADGCTREDERIKKSDAHQFKVTVQIETDTTDMSTDAAANVISLAAGRICWRLRNNKYERLSD